MRSNTPPENVCIGINLFCLQVRTFSAKIICYIIIRIGISNVDFR